MIFGAARPRRPRAAGRPSNRTAERVDGGDTMPPSLIPSIRQLVSTATSLLHTRIALAGVELEEEVQRLVRAAALSFVALLLGFLGIVVGTFTIVIAVPPEYRVWAMLAITLIYLLGAVAAVMQVLGIFRSRPPIFAGTLAELEKDRETLSKMSRAHEATQNAQEREHV